MLLTFIEEFFLILNYFILYFESKLLYSFGSLLGDVFLVFLGTGFFQG